MGNSFSAGDNESTDAQIAGYDIVSILMQNRLVPDINKWRESVKKEDPEGVYIFPFTIIPDNFKSSSLFQEIAFYAVSAAQYAADNPSEDTLLTTMKLLQKVKDPDKPFIPEDFDVEGFPDSPQYARIKAVREETWAKPGMTEDEYLLRLQGLRLKGHLTLFDQSGMVTITIERDVSTKSDKYNGVPRDDLLVTRMYLTPESSMFIGIYQWANQNGLNLTIPQE